MKYLKIIHIKKQLLILKYFSSMFFWGGTDTNEELISNYSVNKILIQCWVCCEQPTTELTSEYVFHPQVKIFHADYIIPKRFMYSASA